MNINLWNNFNTKKSLDLISENKNITLIWPEIKLNPETKELKSSMVSWNKIEDTIMNKFHIIPLKQPVETKIMIIIVAKVSCIEILIYMVEHVKRYMCVRIKQDV